jgi:SAM-dependent methyltransferase
VFDWANVDVIVTSFDPTFNGEAFVIQDGRRRLLGQVRVLIDMGVNESEINWLDSGTLSAYPVGAPILPPHTSGDSFPGGDTDPLSIRRGMARDLTGHGLECGAGFEPFPLPRRCKVTYLDKLGRDQLVERYRECKTALATGPVAPDVIGDIADLGHFADESFDFVIASHVIEHTRNPIQAMVQMHRVLRVGGRLLLIVPDKRRTWDATRPVTSLAHMLEDYECPSRQRDKMHYLETYVHSFPRPPDLLWWCTEMSFQRADDIHFHTFTYGSFCEFVSYVQTWTTAWTHVWSRSTFAKDTRSNEFYFSLTK